MFVARPSTQTGFVPLTTAVTQVVMLRVGDLNIGVPANLMETVLRAPLPAAEVATCPVSGIEKAGSNEPGVIVAACPVRATVTLDPPEGHQPDQY